MNPEHAVASLGLHFFRHDSLRQHQLALEGTMIDLQPGAMPPFGNLYGMDVFVSPELAEDDEIAFSAGTHNEIVRMAYQDFERLVHPRVTSFTT